MQKQINLEEGKIFGSHVKKERFDKSKIIMEFKHEDALLDEYDYPKREFKIYDNKFNKYVSVPDTLNEQDKNIKNLFDIIDVLEQTKKENAVSYIKIFEENVKLKTKIQKLEIENDELKEDIKNLFDDIDYINKRNNKIIFPNQKQYKIIKQKMKGEWL